MLAPLAPTDTFPRALESGRLIRFLWGFSLPFRIAARIRKQAPTEWAAWRRVAHAQVLTTVATAAALAALFFGARALLLAWIESTGGVVDGLDGWKEVAFALIALLSGLEWLVIAFSREHHEQITRAVTLHFQLPPEDPLQTPRIRLDLRWLWRRVRRWARGIKATIGVLPMVLAVSLLFSPFGLSNRASAVLLLIWSFYWGAVIACSKTAYAWRTEGDLAAPAPHYVRWLQRWPIVSLAGRFLGRMTRSSAPAVREVDGQLWEFLGLAGARFLLGLPLLYAFVRPTLPVAAVLVLATPALKPQFVAAAES